MVGFMCNIAEEKEEFEEQAGGMRENVDSWARSAVHAQHRRCKSASDRNLNVPRSRVSAKKDQNETQVSSPSTSASRGQSPWHDNLVYINKNTPSNYRASLEKDIEQLQLRLQQEKSMRNMLERAMGRASSTLSPGHRHFSVQTKELISEIELLEEEVANREQHVLSLYRSIFSNALAGHLLSRTQAYLAYGPPHSSLRKLALFHKAAYNIGGQWLETLLSTAWRKKFGEDRQLRNSKLGLLVSEPLVCFALCTGAFSDPVLKVYTASNVRDELEEAKEEFIKANVVILERFAREASFGSDDLLKWVSENADKKLNDSIHKCIDSKSSKKAFQIIEWVPYNSRFRYVFSKELSERPWWSLFIPNAGRNKPD
ncbi:PREDICTED: electron transporter [Prunus dulcis]|uniref:PREDICTED: electron transporter n=1 Tax=Prunus dulcis TaxID=3755 RepID=A0A5E4GBH1_PRUDU|nr:PREDICTED: electron transporter [Prunus dulcis]